MKKLLPAELITDDNLRTIMRTYNVQQYVTAAVPGKEHKMIISKAGEVDSSHYLDTRSNQVVGFNHVTQTCVADDVAAAEGKDDNENRSAVEVRRNESEDVGNRARGRRVCVKRGRSVRVCVVHPFIDGGLEK